MIGLAWDCGALTTGPVTVPMVLALGLGVAKHHSRPGEFFDPSGFGIVAMASMYPILSVEILALIVLSKSKEEIISHPLAEKKPWYEDNPGEVSKVV